VIAEAFSISPGSRYPEEGDYSGQEFRERILSPLFNQAVKEKVKLIVDLDGTLGYGTSFLEEVFGGLARKESIDIVLQTLRIKYDEEDYLKEDIIEYIKDARG